MSVCGARSFKLLLLFRCQIEVVISRGNWCIYLWLLIVSAISIKWFKKKKKKCLSSNHKLWERCSCGNCGNAVFSWLLQSLTSLLSLQVVRVLLSGERKEEKSSRLGGTIVRPSDKTGSTVTIETTRLIFIPFCVICIPETDCRIELSSLSLLCVTSFLLRNRLIILMLFLLHLFELNWGERIQPASDGASRVYMFLASPWWSFMIISNIGKKF